MNVLIVDDIATNRKLLRAILEAYDMSVVDAADGVEALAVLDREKIDAVISDILMPRMDGYRLCLEVRKSEKSKAIPFIVYTSTYTSPGDEQAALDLGADAFLKKPSPAKEIIQALEEAVKNAPSRQPKVVPPPQELDLMKEYNQRLVNKLEKKNLELQAQTEELLKAERQLRLQATALETAANAILVTDRSGAIQWVNPALTTLTGYTADEVVRQTPRVWKSGKHDLAFYRDLWKTILSGQTWRGEFTNRRKDGSLFYDAHTITPVRSEDGAITHFIGIMHDITERKRSEDALRESEGLLRLVMDLVPHFIFAKDAQSRHLFVNRACAEASGLTPEQMVGRCDFDFVADRAQAEAFARDDQEVIASGKPKLIPEERMTDFSGKTRLLQTIKIPFLAPGTGEPAVLGVAVDITERKKLESEVALREQRLNSFFTGATAGLVLVDRDLRFVQINDTLAEINGVAAKDHLGRTVAEVLPQLAPVVVPLFQKVLITGEPILNIELSGETPRQPGVQRHWLESFFPIAGKDGTPQGVGAIVVEVTERKRAEQRLATHHATTQALAESATLAEAAKRILRIICQNLQWDVGELWTVDPRMKVLRCLEIWHPPSTEFKEFVTSSRQMTFAAGKGLPGCVWETGRPAWIPDLVEESGFQQRGMAAKLGLHGAFAFPIRSGDKILGVMDFLSAKIREPDAESLEMFATVGSQIGQFIERKQLEEQFRQAQKMEAVGQLAGGVAHDFNNLLTVIQGYSQMVLATPNLAPRLVEDLKEILLAGERAGNLTRQLLTFSRKQVMRPQVVDLNELVDGVAKMLRRLIGENIALQTSLAAPLPRIEADTGMVEQVLVNLAVNARDAMAAGGKLTISTAATTIDDAYVKHRPEARAGAFVRLSVQDSGCGMAPEILEHIFEPFFTTKGVGRGTGLGLATVFGIAKQHHGWIEVESQVGVGSTFSLFLPSVSDLVTAVAAAALESKVRGGSETILVVEDEDAVQRVVKAVLHDHGYHVLEATSGPEALTLWQKHASEIALLLTDIVMPGGLTGLELAKKLQAGKPSLKVIYSSGYSLNVAGQGVTLQEGVNFLQKPFSTRHLAQVVRECLDRKS